MRHGLCRANTVKTDTRDLSGQRFDCWLRNVPSNMPVYLMNRSVKAISVLPH